MQIKRGHVPWMACALIMCVALPALASGSPTRAEKDFSVVVSDNKYTEVGGNGDTIIEIGVGDKVNFGYPSGSSTHNVAFTASKPSECLQTQQAGSIPIMDAPPLPKVLEGPGWAGWCRFDVPGDYKFLCEAHAGEMNGIVRVLAASTPSASPSPSPSPSASASASASPSPSPSASPTVTATASPAAFSATPVPTATPVATRAAAKPKFTTATLKRASRTVTLQGTLAAKTGKVKLVVAYGKVKKTLTATVKNGRFATKLKLSRKDARAKKLSVTLTYAGDASFAPATLKKTLKITK